MNYLSMAPLYPFRSLCPQPFATTWCPAGFCFLTNMTHLEACDMYLVISVLSTQLGGTLAGKKLFGSELSCWRTMFTLLDVGSFLKIPRIEGKSSANPVGVFFMLFNPPKCLKHQKSIKYTISTIKWKIP